MNSMAVIGANFDVDFGFCSILSDFLILFWIVFRSRFWSLCVGKGVRHEFSVSSMRAFLRGPSYASFVCCFVCFIHSVTCIYSAVGIATGYWLDDWEVGVWVPVVSRIFTSPCCPDRLWGPPNLLYNGYRGFFPGGKEAGAWSWPLTSN
jgi:hypothetical protein